MASTILASLGQPGLGEARVAPSALEPLRNIRQRGQCGLRASSLGLNGMHVVAHEAQNGRHEWWSLGTFGRIQMQMLSWLLKLRSG